VTLIDIGTNLSNKAFRGDLDGVLARALAAGVGGIVAIGVSVPASRAVWEIAEAKRTNAPRIWCTAGIHPHHASSFSPDARVALRELHARKEVVAVGECGLDFDRDFSPRDAQVACFEAQLELAAEVKKPVYLHERAAHAAFAEILAKHRSRLVGGVVHCFTGDANALARYLDLDLHIGLTGWICDERRGTHLRDLVRRIPRGRLVIETDAPYILPRDLPKAMRPPGGKNEAMTLPHIARVIAKHRGETPEDLAAHTTSAANALFGLGAVLVRSVT
jgi:TatD DNase family protein